MRRNTWLSTERSQGREFSSRFTVNDVTLSFLFQILMPASDDPRDWLCTCLIILASSTGSSFRVDLNLLKISTSFELINKCGHSWSKCP